MLVFGQSLEVETLFINSFPMIIEVIYSWISYPHNYDASPLGSQSEVMFSSYQLPRVGDLLFLNLSYPEIVTQRDASVCTHACIVHVCSTSVCACAYVHAVCVRADAALFVCACSVCMCARGCSDEQCVFMCACSVCDSVKGG